MSRHSFQPLLEQHLRVRVSPVVREDGSGSNTYNIEAISSSDSDTTDSDDSEERVTSQPANDSLNRTGTPTNADNEEFSDIEALSSDSSSSSSSSATSPTNTSMNNDELLVGFASNLEPVNASWNNSSNDSNGPPSNVIHHDGHEQI